MTGAGSVLVIGTMDTKSAELLFLKARITGLGTPARIVDVSTSGRTSPDADVAPDEVAAHHPKGADAVFSGDRGTAVAAMSEALCRCIGTLAPAAAIGIGGSGGTALIAPALRRLALGVPKVMVSTVASGDTAPYVDTSDLVLFPSVTDIGGLNRISMPILANAAAAVVGMARADRAAAPDARPAIGLTMFGVTTRCVTRAAQHLGAGFDPIVFHATGTGGRAMEDLAEQGFLQGVLDLTTTELCDRLAGGLMPAGPDRITRIARCGIPYVGSAGALDMVNFGSPDTIPERYSDRLFHHHNPQITLMRTTAEECRRIGIEIGAALNQFEGPAVFLIPQNGVSALDAEGQPFRDPDADEALFAAIEETTRQTGIRRVQRLPLHINDEAFAIAAARALERMMDEVTP